MLERLALLIRDHELAKAARLSSRIARSRGAETRRSDFVVRHAMLSAAIDIKRGRPDKAANKLTRLLGGEQHYRVADDPVFLANVGALFTLLGDDSRARIVLSLVPPSHPVFSDQASVWQTMLAAPTTTARIAAVPEGKSTQKRSGKRTLREREADWIVELKREMAAAAAAIRNPATSLRPTIRRLRSVLRRTEKIAERSTAVQRLRDQIEKLVCRAVLLL